MKTLNLLPVFILTLIAIDVSGQLRCTFHGSNAGYSGTDNSYLGWSAGDVSTGSWNSILGSEAGRAMTSGTYNTFAGYMSGRYLTTGSDNTFLGSYSVSIR